MIHRKNSHASHIVLLLALLFISCEKPHPEIEEDIAIMEGDIPEPDTTAVDEECIYDTSYYKLTMEALLGIPAAKDIVWVESEHTAIVQWRGNEVRRKRGGCMHFYDDLALITRDTTTLEDSTYWLGKAYEVSKHFGLPYYPQAIVSREIVRDESQPNSLVKLYQLDLKQPPSDDRVFDGLLFARIGESTRISFSQYLQ